MADGGGRSEEPPGDSDNLLGRGTFSARMAGKPPRGGLTEAVTWGGEELAVGAGVRAPPGQGATKGGWVGATPAAGLDTRRGRIRRGRFFHLKNPSRQKTDRQLAGEWATREARPQKGCPAMCG